jgi:hypothetical protein
MAHELLGEILQAQRVLCAQPLLHILTAGSLDCLQMKEIRADQQRLHIVIGDCDPSIVRVVYELLQRHRVNVVDRDHLLLGLDQVVHEHRIEVGNAGGEDNAMRRELVVLRHQRYVAELAQATYLLHVLEAILRPVCVDKVFYVGEGGSAARRNSRRISARCGRKLARCRVGRACGRGDGRGRCGGGGGGGRRAASRRVGHGQRVEVCDERESVGVRRHGVGIVVHRCGRCQSRRCLHICFSEQEPTTKTSYSILSL